MPDFGLGQELDDSLGHSQASSQNREDSHGISAARGTWPSPAASKLLARSAASRASPLEPVAPPACAQPAESQPAGCGRREAQRACAARADATRQTRSTSSPPRGRHETQSGPIARRSARSNCPNVHDQLGSPNREQRICYTSGRPPAGCCKIFLPVGNIAGSRRSQEHRADAARLPLILSDDALDPKLACVLEEAGTGSQGSWFVSQ